MTGMLLLSVPLLVPLACSDDVTNNYITNVYGEAGAGDSGAGGNASDSYPGAPEADTEIVDHSPDVFGSVGNRYWFGVSEEQLEEMNEGLGQGGPIFEQNGDDIYVPGGSVPGNYADHLWVTTPRPDEKTADYGKVEVKIVGQSTQRPWTRRTIPNLNVDFDEFVDEQRIGGFEHLRFNNGQVGSIFRERVTLELFARLKYPAPRASYGWVSSNVWGANVAVPYVVVERYKRSFCKHWEDRIGGGCANIWEFVGDFTQGDGIPGGPAVGSVFDDPNICEFSECDNTRGRKLEAAVRETPLGDGFKQALSDWIHWPSFHRFQCLSWVLATGDDALHNMNNVVVMERADGLFQYLPYSVDISLGQEWYPTVPLPGMNSIARGCQSDAACWADTVAACKDIIAEFEDIDPKAVLDGVHEELSTEGMLRPGDEERYQAIRDWFEERLSELPTELEDNREPPLVCPPEQVDCGGYCDYYENCGNNCEPPPPAVEAAGGAGGGDGAGGDDGVAGGDGGICPPLEHYGVRE